MPELPEVETTLKGIEPHIINKRIEKVLIRQPKLRWEVPSSQLKKYLPNESFSNASRRAKYLILKCKPGSLIIHLGMSGSLKVLSKLEKPKKHDHIDILFVDKTVLRFTDPRKFGSFHWTKNPENFYLLKNLGPEPLGNEFSAEYLFRYSRKRKVPIKNFIMNSHVIAGIGNIYACESLFLAGINPKRQAGLITFSEWKQLLSCIRSTLENSIAAGGTTLRDFFEPSGKTGYYAVKLSVYGKENEPCPKCATPISRLIHSGRSTFFCNTCQSSTTKRKNQLLTLA